MSARLAVLRWFFPAPLKLLMLRELAQVTAEGFSTPVPEGVRHGSFEARRAAYAEYTAEEARRLAPADITAVKARLRRGAAGLGAAVRRRLGLRGPTETFAAWRLLYHELGIEVSGGPRGELTITRCFFAGYYDESVCAVIEALDDGLADGLFGGASLVFSTRLTSGGRPGAGEVWAGGRPCCHAILRLSPRGIEEER
jgi:hypothetical protein